MDKFNWNLLIFNIIKFLLSAVVNKNNRGCGCGCEFNNRMAVAVVVVEKCAVVTRLRLNKSWLFIFQSPQSAYT